MPQRNPLAERVLEDIRNDTPTTTLPFRNGGRIPFWRLDDDEYLLLGRQSLAIEDDYLFLMQLNSAGNQHKRLQLAEARTALTKLAGPSCKSFDNFKQSFSFPFLHGVPTDRPSADYLMTVQDVRGSLYFSHRRVVAKADSRIKEQGLHKAFVEEFNREELNVLAATMYGFLEGFSNYVTPPPFVEKVDSEHIVYGYAKGSYFEEQHKDHQAYKSAIDQWRQIVVASDDRKENDSQTGSP